MITSEQLRAARGLLRVTQEDIAEATGVSIPTLRRWEGASGPIAGTATNVDAVQKYLTNAGVEFIDANGGGVGVRLKDA